MMQADLRALLVNDAALTALVNPSDIEWDRYRQTVGDPAIRLSFVNGQEGLTMQGGDGLFESVVRVGVRGKILSNVWAVEQRLKEFQGYRGTVGNTYFSQIATPSRGLPTEETSIDTYYFRVVDFEIWHRAS